MEYSEKHFQSPFESSNALTQEQVRNMLQQLS